MLTSGSDVRPLYFDRSSSRVLTWFFTLIIGFFVAYFLVFHVRNQLLAIGLFLICTVPFWTSNIIRMISWIPLLGKEGLINQALICVGRHRRSRSSSCCFPISRWWSAYVHQLHDLHDRADLQFDGPHRQAALFEAALDAGASRFEIMRSIIVPLCKNGIALGSIFVVSIVMGDFFVIKVMCGGGRPRSSWRSTKTSGAAVSAAPRPAPSC